MEQDIKFSYQIRVNRLRDLKENFQNLICMVEWLKENIGGGGYMDGPPRKWDMDINGTGNSFYYTFSFLEESHCMAFKLAWT